MATKKKKSLEELIVENDQLKAKIFELEKTKLNSSIWLENSPVCTKIVDPDFNLQYMSSSGIRELKIDDITEFYGKPYPFSFYPESFKKLMRQNLEKARDTGKTVSQEASVLDIKGNTLWYHSTIVPVKDNKGALDYIMVVSLETTAQKIIETELRKSEQRFKDLVNTINSGVAIYEVINDGKSGQDYIIQDFNDFAVKHEKLDKKDIIGKSLAEIRPNIDEYGLIQTFRKVWKTGEPAFYPAKVYVDEKYSNYYENRVFRLPSGEIVAVYDDVTDQKKAENKILAAEENLKNTFNLSPSIISKANISKGYFFEVSPAVTKILGYSFEEFTSRPIMEFIHPDDIQRTTLAVENLLKGKELNFFENRYLCKDGSYKWLAWNSSKADKNGIVTVIGSDINDRKIVEQRISETKQFYEDIIEGVQDGIWVTDKDDVIYYANTSMEKIAGIPREQIQGNSILKDFPKETTGEIIDFYNQAKKEKKPIWYDIKVKTPSGKNTWQNGWLIPKYQDKKFVGIICSVRDVTEQKLAESSVRRLSSAVLQSPSIIVITDVDGKLEYINPKFTELTGYKRSEVIGQKPSILKSGEHDDAFYKEMCKTITTGKGWRGEFRNKKKNGEFFWEAASISSIKNEMGEIINYIKIGEDITKQKNTEYELKMALKKAVESDRLKSAFLSNMSHEIRTPMNGILGFIELMNNPNISKSQSTKYSAIIQKSSNRLLNTINDIIDISKIEAGETVITIEQISINNLLNELHTFHFSEAAGKGLSFVMEPFPEEESTTIVSDSTKLHGILTNLLKNAIKYTEEGEISFGCVMKDDFVEFFVKDTGIGIPKDRLKAVFNRFEQADIGNKRTFEGSGLGLAISKAYVEMLGGKILVESVEGKGSRFSFTIPSNTKSENVRKKSSENTGNLAPNLKKMNLLIVEDDDISAEYLQTILGDLFRKIRIAKNGIEAVEYCKLDPNTDLILMDIQLPEMDGYQATREIRRFNKNVIIIAQTAFALVGDREKATEAGCDDYISKPINKALLLEVLSRNLGSKET